MKYYKTTTKYNCGIDLHTRCMYICVMDLDGNILVHRNIKKNDFAFFLKLVEPYRHDLTVAPTPNVRPRIGEFKVEPAVPCSGGQRAALP